MRSGLSTSGSLMIVGVGMKMWLGYAESLRYLTELAAVAPALGDVSLFVLPSYPAIPAARELLTGSGVAFGAQDGHWEDIGPHTGSVSPAMLAELGCSVMEVGHAERRRDFGEDDAMTARKAAAAARCGLVPVVCVGEERQTADAEVVVLRQLDTVLSALPEDAALMVAYEPVWAIGADRPAGVAHVERLLDAVRALSTGRQGPTKVLYGGGVAPGAVAELIAAGADGVFASRSALTIAGLERIAGEAATRRP